MNAAAAPPLSVARPGDRAVLRRAARLAQRLLRRLVSLDGDGSRRCRRSRTPRCMPGDAGRQGPLDDGDDGEAPWHDQTMPLAERMKLAEGRPLRRRMMAAMAQQDCGQCGYNCEDYSDAIVPQEGRAAQPVRAGRQGNRPHAQGAVRGDRQSRPRRPPARAGDGAAPTARRRRPAARATIRSSATFVSRTRLNKPGSEKETWHSSSISPRCGLDYVVGDAFGALSRTTIRRWSMPSSSALGAPADFADRRRARCARC